MSVWPARAAMGLLTQPVSFAGCPVAVAPMWPEVAKDSPAMPAVAGLPLGVQLIAAPWREDLCLRTAAALERMGLAHLKPSALDH